MGEIKQDIQLGAEHMRQLAKQNTGDFYSVIQLINQAAIRGLVSISVVDLFDTDVETTLGELGYSVRHQSSPNGRITEISW